MNNKRYIINMLVLVISTTISIFAFAICFPMEVLASDEIMENEVTENEIIDEQAEMDEVKSVEDHLKKYSNGGIKEIIPDYNPENIIKDVAKGKFEFNLPGIINRILMILFKEIYLNINILIKLIVLVILCAVLKNLQTSFLNKSVGELAFYICYIVLVSILLVSFNTAIKAGIEIIDAMVNFMYASIPVLITLLISSGNFTSGGVLQPLLITIVQVSATIIKNIFIPLIILSTIISVVDNISEKIQISRLGGFLKHITSWSLGLILTLFVAIVSLQGSLGAVVDGVTGKTAKFAIGAFIPIAGKYLADAADAVIGCTLLIKNAVGVAIMIGIIGICLMPVIKMLAIIVLYRMTCVLLEPVAEGRIIKCISEVANSMTFVMGIVASVAFMFLITVTALITASNLSAMMR
ncbi:MAG: stage III sporulation protein AE [Bacillota bacterium]